MSGFDWNNIFKLPEVALAGNRRIPKTVLVKQVALTKNEQRVLDKVSRLEHFATVQKSTTRIPPLIDDVHDVQSVVFLRCETCDGTDAYVSVARLLHKCFPNPTVILFDDATKLCISVATTRRSLAEKGAVVVDVVESTGWIYAGDEGLAAYYESLAFDKLPQENLQAYLDGIAWNTKLTHAAGAFGSFPSCPEHRRDEMRVMLSKLDAFNKELEALVWRRHKDKSLTLNESAHLRMREKQLRKEIDGIVEEMKAVCGG